MIDEFEKKHGDILKAMSPTSPKEIGGKSAQAPKDQGEQLAVPEVFVKSLSNIGSQATSHADGHELKSLEFEFLLLQKRCEELGKERDRLKKDLGEMKKHPVGGELLPKVKELSEHNDKLAQDNAKLVKVAKNLEQKADERKKNLKKLFNLMAEKEKELNVYKSNYNSANKTNNESFSQMSKKLEGLVNQRQNEMAQRCEELGEALEDRERALRHLEEVVVDLRNTVLSMQQIKEHQEILTTKGTGVRFLIIIKLKIKSVLKMRETRIKA